MEQYCVKKMKAEKKLCVEVPGSKSITNRALLMAALSDGRVKLSGVLFSDDSRYFLKALETLGFEVEIREEEKEVIVVGAGGRIPKDAVTIYVGSAGTAARFLTSMLALSGGTYVIDASEQMKRRPMKPLFEALEMLGASFEYLEQPYFLPVRICRGAQTEKMGRVELDIAKTSQPLSALLMTGTMLKKGLEIHVTGDKKGGSYVEITRKMMESFGCQSEFDGNNYYIRPESGYHLDFYQVEPDVSAACYFYAMAAITGGSAVVKHIYRDTLQGDIRFVDTLEKMGCQVWETEKGICVQAPRSQSLHGISVDMNAFSDQALTMAAIAVFAESPVEICNVAHIRLQECDRLHAIASNLERLGIRYEEREDGILIVPGEPQEAEIETFEDHRVAMAFTLVGLKKGGITILNPMCCRKTFEHYFDLIDALTSE